METKQAIKIRRSIRQYDSKPLTKKQLQTIVQAGRQAANAYGYQQFKFIVIRNKAILQKLDQLSADLLKDEYEARDFFNAPQIILVTGRRDNGACYMDAGCAMTNMMLTAADMGLGSCWNNQFYTISDCPQLVNYLTRLRISKQEVICACLVVGHPAADHVEERKKLISEVYYFD